MKYANLDAIEHKGQRFKYAQIKRDGHRVVIYRRPDGSFLSMSKRGKPYKMFEGYAEHYNLTNLPCDTFVEGELFGHGVHTADIRTMINDGRGSSLEYEVFAMPYLGGMFRPSLEIPQVNDMLLDWRINHSELVFPHHIMSNVPLGMNAHIDWSVWKVGASSRDLLKYAVDYKLEGFMLKLTNYTGWYKLKPLRTVDCVVTRTTKSTEGTYAGGIKALVVSVVNEKGNMEEIADVSGGLTLEDRERPRAYYVGRVVEVSYQAITKFGRLQFARLVGMRDDKPTHLCTKDQIC